MDKSSKIICLSFMASFDYIRLYHKNDEDIGISPDPTKVMPFEVKHPYEPIVLLTSVAAKPKSVMFIGSYREVWHFTLN